MVINHQTVSVIIPVHNGADILPRCLEALFHSEGLTLPDDSFEVIVVDDCSTDETGKFASKMAGSFPVRMVSTNDSPNSRGSDKPHGPAYARNLGAAQANGELLVFIDADVTVHTDTISKIVHIFQENPQVTAVFGSYDDQPAQRDFFSQYKNLVHHFVHQNGKQEAATFWSGCGAIRRKIFLEVGGFDATKYPRPSIEDIELGYRLTSLGYEIRLEKDIQVKHLKRWSFTGLVGTDIRQRAVPWSSLIWTRLFTTWRSLLTHNAGIRKKNQPKSSSEQSGQAPMPNDLNLNSSQRISMILILLILVNIAFFLFISNLVLLPLVIVFALLCASCWHWQDADPAFEISSHKEPLIFGTVTMICILALWNNQPLIIVPFVILVPLLIMGNWLTHASVQLRRFFYFSMVLGNAAIFGLLLTSYPVLLWIPMLVLLLAIVILNRRLYLFFIQKRGILFALAALPMQLLYYLYSFFTFLGVGIIQIWKVAFHRH
jgi:glycosyltransferase involved in cell wall biosynthesis